MGKHFSCFKNKKYIFAITFVSTVQADFVYAEHELFEISLGALKLQSIVHITGDDQILYKYVLNRQSIFFLHDKISFSQDNRSFWSQNLIKKQMFSIYFDSDAPTPSVFYSCPTEVISFEIKGPIVTGE